MRARILTLVVFAIIFISNSCQKGDDTETLNPEACYEYSPNGLIAEHTAINFTNCSEHATTYSWDFGDGATSDAKNPSHTFTEAGAYTVSLMALNSKKSSSVTQIVQIGSSFTGPNSGKYLLLDGNDDYGQVEYNNELDFDSEITIEAKIYISKFDSPNGSVWRWNEEAETIMPIISQSHTGSSIGDFTFGLTQTRLLFGFETLDSRFHVNYNFEVEKWYNVAVVHSLGEGNQIQVYINGVSYQGEWRNDSGEVMDGNDMSIPNSGSPYWIGTNKEHADSGDFEGRIDDLSVWKIRRTFTQIRSDFENGIDINEAGLISYWNFEELIDNRVSDMKNDNDITLFSGASLAE